MGSKHLTVSCVLVALSEAEQTFTPRLGSGIALAGHEMALLGRVSSLLPLHHQGSLGGELVDRGLRSLRDSMLSLRKKEGCGLASWARGHGPLTCTSELRP